MENKSNLNSLKQFIANYGEIQALKDISLMYQDLSKEWFAAGDRRYGFVFSDASMSIADTAYKLETAEERYTLLQQKLVASNNLK